MPKDKLRLVRERIIEKIFNAGDDEISELKDNLDLKDPHFQSELEYDGYDSIEEYDNEAYNSKDVERTDDSDAEGESSELHFEDREDKLNTGEESLVDHQEHKK